MRIESIKPSSNHYSFTLQLLKNNFPEAFIKTTQDCSIPALVTSASGISHNIYAALLCIIHTTSHAKAKNKLSKMRFNHSRLLHHSTFVVIQNHVISVAERDLPITNSIYKPLKVIFFVKNRLLCSKEIGI